MEVGATAKRQVEEVNWGGDQGVWRVQVGVGWKLVEVEQAE